MSRNSTPCSRAVDDQFGPVVACQDFDFTLSFEHTIFIIGISSLFLISFPVRLGQLYGASIKTFAGPFRVVKTGIAIVILLLQVAGLVLWTRTSTTKYAIAVGSISLISAIAVVFLVVLEHTRTVRPSTITSIYLLTSIVGDAIQLRTISLRGYPPSLSYVLSAVLASKVVLLILESWSKKKYLKPTSTEYGPEDTTGFLAGSVLWWLNSLFLRDCTKGKSSLAFVIISCIWRPFLLTIFPRATHIAFKYSQSFLIDSAVSYLDKPVDSRDRNHAYGLIGATALVYIGMTFSNVFHSRTVFRMQAIFRSAICPLVYNKALSTKSDGNELDAITFMSTDVDRLNERLRSIVDLWALFIEVGIGIGLLTRQLGVVSIAPIIVVLLCFAAQSFVSRLMPRKEKIWLQAIGNRVKFTSNLLRSMKSIKLTGLVGTSARLLQDTRIEELHLAKVARALKVAQNVIANLPEEIAGLAAFAAFSIQANIRHTAPLSTAQAFTSLALILILAGPAGSLLHAFPEIIATKPSYDRLQKFLLEIQIEDKRDFSGKSVEQEKPSSDFDDSPSLLSGTNLHLDVPSLSTGNAIDFSLSKGSVCMISGPVGCGKSTLLKTVLGEKKPKSGSVHLRTPYIGYCGQIPWIQNCSIKQNIIGVSKLDESWYQHVIHVCNLEVDFDQILDGDETVVGSRGLSISGGQKHRVALARVLYSRCPILVLDDPFGALDRRTQITVAKRLFSAEGHAREHGTIVLFTSHSIYLAQYTDKVIELDPNASMAFFGSPKEWNIDRKHVMELSAGEDIDKVNKNMSSNAHQTARKPQEAETAEMLKSQVGDTTLWLYYAKSIGAWHIFFQVLFTTLYVVGSSFPKIWLKQSTGISRPDIGVFIGVYAAANALSTAATFCMIWQILIRITSKSGIKLHEILVNTIFNAPMSFFEDTDTSILLNRFSQDITLIDRLLPIATWQIYLTMGSCVAQLALIAIGSNYMAATIPVAVLTLYLVQKFYLKTSRQIRLIDLEAKSPIYQHYTETLEGLLTIRGFGWQEKFEQDACKRLDHSQKPFYLMRSIQIWLNLVLDLIVTVLAVVLVTMALCIPNSSNAGSLGVALNTILGFNTSLQELITMWTLAETSIGSIARIKSFQENTPNENSPDSDGTNTSPDDFSWQNGAVGVSELTVQYSNGSIALEDLNFRIEAGQHFGICGKTGSGKSTLLSILLRLLDPTKGNVYIDGLDISNIPRNVVRSRLICLPQDPLLFPGTFKLNLDPDDSQTISTTEVGSILKRLKLWELIEDRGGLDATIMSENLSQGEQQLLVLGRAILRKRALKGQRSILILDEATSNLDSVSETAFHQVIREEFANDTIISVAHRLETLQDCDTILVLDRGRIAKMGPPVEVMGQISWDQLK